VLKIDTNTIDLVTSKLFCCENVQMLQNLYCTRYYTSRCTSWCSHFLYYTTEHCSMYMFLQSESMQILQT